MSKKQRTNDKGEVLCPTCDIHKSRSSFGKSSRSPIGLNWQCKSCANERRADVHYRHRYGITKEDKLQLMEEQENKCACCHNEFGDTPRTKPVVDHCHETGAVREILCDRCNVALGIIGEDILLAKQLIKYIEKHK